MEEAFDSTDQSDDNLPFRALDIQTFRYGEEVIREGENVSLFYVILSGQIRISQHGKKIRLLEANDVLGLECLVFRKPSDITARALTKSRVAAYGLESFDHFIRENPRMTHSILLSLLQQLDQTSRNLAEGSDVFALEDVQVNFYNDGDTIIEEGSKGTNFYRLVSSQGGLRVSIAGKPASVISRPGEFFGEMAGLLNLPRQATITSIGESVVEEYNLDDLDVIIKDYPEVALQLMRTLVARLVEANQKLIGSTA
ncbi:MAG: cyclic nucleotide-binding domain-containing protein [Syntrophobacteraceae bacterium]